MVNSFCSNLFLHHTRTSFTDNLSTPRKNNSFSAPTAILFLPFWRIISSILYARSNHPVFWGIRNIILTSRHRYLGVILLFSRNRRISARSSRPEVSFEFCEISKNTFFYRTRSVELQSLASSVKAFNFQNITETRPNMLNATLREGWLWHAISKIRKKLEIFT